MKPQTLVQELLALKKDRERQLKKLSQREKDLTTRLANNTLLQKLISYYSIANLRKELAMVQDQKSQLVQELALLDAQFKQAAKSPFASTIKTISQKMSELSTQLSADLKIRNMPLTQDLTYQPYPSTPHLREQWKKQVLPGLDSRFSENSLSQYATRLEEDKSTLAEQVKKFDALHLEFLNAVVFYRQGFVDPPEIFDTVKKQLRSKEADLEKAVQALRAGSSLQDRFKRDLTRSQVDDKMNALYQTFYVKADTYIAERKEKFWFRDGLQAMAALFLKAWHWESSQLQREKYIKTLKSTFEATLKSRDYKSLLTQIDDGVREFSSRTTEEKDPEKYKMTMQNLLLELKEGVEVANPDLKGRRNPDASPRSP